MDLQGQPSCSIDDVTVSCGEQGRRKRGTNTGANSELKIRFKLKVPSTSKVTAFLSIQSKVVISQL